MAANIAASRPVDFALRALQLIFAVIVMGTDGYAIHTYRGHTVYEHFEFGNFYAYAGVPDAWGFLIFCAGWTFLDVILHLIAETRFPDIAVIGYIRVAGEGIALLSWLAGFVAVAVNIGSDTCPAGKSSCGPLTAATVFGALEWLLFVVTTILTFNVVFNHVRRQNISKTETSAVSADIPT
ncbi:membrane-associating domain-containing protein [Aspergillus pseudoustus]|uniref:Membrane-associating domain-containing protein n=1 Tax=Aspergillus pseudoustus TaxID=1810923 RepID=A0ABR4L2N5_9EURO